jgi:hypothetical protein
VAAARDQPEAAGEVAEHNLYLDQIQQLVVVRAVITLVIKQMVGLEAVQEKVHLLHQEHRGRAMQEEPPMI